MSPYKKYVNKKEQEPTESIHAPTVQRAESEKPTTEPKVRVISTKKEEVKEPQKANINVHFRPIPTKENATITESALNAIDDEHILQDYLKKLEESKRNITKKLEAIQNKSSPSLAEPPAAPVSTLTQKPQATQLEDEEEYPEDSEVPTQNTQAYGYMNQYQAELPAIDYHIPSDVTAFSKPSTVPMIQPAASQAYAPYIIDADGGYYDEEGRYYDAEGGCTEVDGSYTDAEGYRYDAEGNPLDEAQYVDANGNPVYEYYDDGYGNIVDAQGNPLYVNEDPSQYTTSDPYQSTYGTTQETQYEVDEYGNPYYDEYGNELYYDEKGNPYNHPPTPHLGLHAEQHQQ